MICSPPAGHVRDGDFPGFMEGRRHRTHGSVYFVFPEANSPEVRERYDQADGAMNAHPQISDIIKVDDASGAPGSYWLRNHRTDDNFRAPRLIHKGVAQMVVMTPEFVEALSHGGSRKNGPAADDDAGRLATRVRVHHPNAINQAVAVGWDRGRRGPFAERIGYAFHLVGSR